MPPDGRDRVQTEVLHLDRSDLERLVIAGAADRELVDQPVTEMNAVSGSEEQKIVVVPRIPGVELADQPLDGGARVKLAMMRAEQADGRFRACDEINSRIAKHCGRE